ncbi:hypothetical protein LINGRAPRIM_LOCUS398 [Linum grandiflorum]
MSMHRGLLLLLGCIGSSALQVEQNQSQLVDA